MLRKTNKNSWTDEANGRLKVMVAQGATVLRAAAAFRRTIASVRRQAHKLGTPFPPLREVRKKWVDTPSNPWRPR
jgi:GcrA cell cycle regulator